MKTSISLKEANKDHVRLLAEAIYGTTIEEDNRLETFLEILSEDLTGQEAAVLILKHGLEEGTNALSLLETSEIFGVSREKMRQVEYKALVKLKHPVRIKKVIGEKPELPKITLDTKIVDCDLLTKTINILKKNKIKTVKDLLDMRLEVFFKSEGLTNQVINDVNTFIRYINL